ncbi:Gfo/Idh/MocA family oxidoreductase [Micrococcaceae bacterium Sec5.7]
MKSLKVGLLGAGGISPVHVNGWKALGAQISVYAVAGAPALAEEHGLQPCETPEELIHNAEIVCILTPSKYHRELALAAIEAGKHVVCEKPLGVTTEDSLAIAAAAAAANIQVYPAHVVRFFPDYARLKSEVESGRIGTPAILRFSRSGAAPSPGSWFFSEPDGGGIILDQMIHDLDQARWIAGDVVQVYAVQNPPTIEGQVPEAVAAQVVLTHASGAISYIQGAWGPRTMPFLTSFEVAGSTGVLRYDSRNDSTLVMDQGAAPEGASYLPPESQAESPYTTQIREFATAFSGGPPPRVSAADGVLAVALAEAAQESVRSGTAVDFDSAAILAPLMRSHAV